MHCFILHMADVCSGNTGSKVGMHSVHHRTHTLIHILGNCSTIHRMTFFIGGRKPEESHMNRWKISNMEAVMWCELSWSCISIPVNVNTTHTGFCACSESVICLCVLADDVISFHNTHSRGMLWDKEKMSWLPVHYKKIIKTRWVDMVV